ncbi:MAG: NUDIX hydrolase [Pseudomonadota bacterium]
MGRQQIKDVPNKVKSARKLETRVQFAALCYRRRKSGLEVLLLTSRDTGRWIIPKGWPINGRSPAETAAQEAWEEGGVKGKMRDVCLGLYSYEKSFERGNDLPVAVAVFPIEVARLSDRYPEAGARKRRWFTPKKAAARVKETGLKQIIRSFDPARLR